MVITEKIHVGSHHYRAFVGPIEKYDLVGAMQFNLLTVLGLREHHYLLDIGCGSLRAGRLFIPYLQPGHYCGIEPNSWLVDEGIRNECGTDQIALKKPEFDTNFEFISTVFNRKFDFILAHSIFTHAGQKQIRKCLLETKKVMKQNTIFVATFMEGEQDYEGDEWVYPKVVTYKLSTIKALVKSFDLRSQPIHWPHPNNHTWLLISLSKNTSPLILSLTNMTNLFRVSTELKYYKQRVKQLESCFYVKMGKQVNKLIRRAKLGLSARKVARRLYGN